MSIVASDPANLLITSFLTNINGKEKEIRNQGITDILNPFPALTPIGVNDIK